MLGSETQNARNWMLRRRRSVGLGDPLNLGSPLFGLKCFLFAREHITSRQSCKTAYGSEFYAPTVVSVRYDALESGGSRQHSAGVMQFQVVGLFGFIWIRVDISVGEVNSKGNRFQSLLDDVQIH